MKNKKSYNPESGRIMGADNKIYNKVELYKEAGSTAQPVDNSGVNITQFVPQSRMIVGEDGKVYNEADLLKGIGDHIPNAGNTDTATDFRLKRQSFRITGDEASGISSGEALTLSGADVVTLSSPDGGIQLLAENDLVYSNSTTNVLETKNFSNEYIGTEKYITVGTDLIVKPTTSTGKAYLLPYNVDKANKTSDMEIATVGYVNAHSGGIGGSSYEEVVLWENTTSTSGNITGALSDTLTNYDAVFAVMEWTLNGNILTFIVPMPTSAAVGTHAFEYGNDIYYNINYPTATTFDLQTGKPDVCKFAKIVGIKYGGSSDYITIDDEMSDTSENPVQNKAVKAYIDGLFARYINNSEEV